MSSNPNQLEGDVQVNGTLEIENPVSGNLGVVPQYVVTITGQGHASPLGRGAPSVPEAALYVTGGKVPIQANNPDGLAIDATSSVGTAMAGSSAGNQTATEAIGVQGSSTYGTGVVGSSNNGIGVQALSTAGIGMQGKSQETDGIVGISQSDQHSCVIGAHPGAGNGVAGHSTSGYGVDAYSESGVGLHAVGGGGAAVIDGTLTVNGNHTVNGTLTVDVDIILLNQSQDCAEEFELPNGTHSEPGAVMVLGLGGRLEVSSRPYDKRVAGVVSGAGEYRPGLVLGRRDCPDTPTATVALLGKVICKSDAGYGAIEVGDLLTTSSTPGHAMKASDRTQAFGTVIGKALADLPAGRGLIPVLVALQ